MPLTVLQVENAKPREKDCKLADAGGLHLFVNEKAHKSWRLRYDSGGKERRLALGSFSDMSLNEARDARDAAKRLLRDHRDPSVEAHKRKVAAPCLGGGAL